MTITPKSRPEVQMLLEGIAAFLTEDTRSHGVACMCHMCMIHGYVNDARWHMNQQFRQFNCAESRQRALQVWENHQEGN
jgi:hypothetical protein